MTRIKRSAVAVAGILAIAGVGFLIAEDKPAGVGPPRPDDEKAIRAASQTLAKAFEKGDAQAVAACWTEEGEYIDEGATPVRGREALAKAYAGFFAKRPPVTVESKTNTVRFLGKDTAVEEGRFVVHVKDRPDISCQYSSLYVKQDGKWLIAVLKEWDDESTSNPTLDSLAWLVGTWESGSGDVSAKTTYEWVENKKFIRSQYSIKSTKPGGTNSTGTQMIGVDPATGGIHAWTFDSEGGVGEASWTWDGERWVIDSTGTLADGSNTTARNFMSKSGNDAFTWKSVERKMEGNSMPDLGPITVKRVTK